MIKNLKYKWRSLVTGIRNLIKWAPVIYKDRDWDQWFIYQILKTKLQHQADYLTKHGHLENSLKYAQQIHKCIEMIDIVQNERVIEDYLSSVNPYEDGKLSWEALDEVETKHRQAKKDLFEYLEKNIEYWWD